MRRKFGLTPRQLPLVEFDPKNWQAPFRPVVPAAIVPAAPTPSG